MVSTPDSLLISTGQAWVHCANGRIVQTGVDPTPKVAADDHIHIVGGTILPGFIDIHVHGAMGFDTMDALPLALQTIAAFLARHGVTAFLATTWTDSPSRVLAALQTVATCCGPQPGGATLLGAHVEGPFLNPAKAGAQNHQQIRRATVAEVQSMAETDAVKVLSLAPEYAEHLPIIEWLSARGIVVSAAHTDATYADMQRAVQRGLSNVTHTFNAMRPLHHREPGVVGAALLLPELMCELIADNHHVHPAAMKLLWEAKGVENIVLVSDAVSAAGLDVGTYPLGGRTALVENGTIRLDSGTLAGSLLTLNMALKHFTTAVDEPLADVWPVSSLNAARVLGLDDRKGHIAPGYDADLVVIDADFQVQLTVAMGTVVYRREPDA